MESKPITILITGSTGFLGSHIVTALSNDDRFFVVATHRTASNLSRLAYAQKDRYVSYNTDDLSFDSIFKCHTVDHIVHVATEYGRGTTSADGVLRSNLIMPINLLEAGIKHGVQTFINTDSYFNKKNLSYSHLANYSISKKCFNSWLEHYSEKIKVVNLVLEHIYGPWDQSDKFVEQMIQSIAIQNSPSLDLTHGHQQRDFVYVDDVVEAYRCTLLNTTKQQFRHRTYSVGTGKTVAIRTFVEKIAELGHSSTTLNFGRLPYRFDEIMHSSGDPLELSNHNWAPRWTIDDGISKIISLYRHDRATK